MALTWLMYWGSSWHAFNQVLCFEPWKRTKDKRAPFSPLGNAPEQSWRQLQPPPLEQLPAEQQLHASPQLPAPGPQLPALPLHPSPPFPEPVLPLSVPVTPQLTLNKSCILLKCLHAIHLPSRGPDASAWTISLYSTHRL